MNRLRRALEVLLGYTEPVAPVALLGRSCAWDDPDREGTRRDAALSIMDPDVEGFVLVRFHSEFHGPRATSDVCHIVRSDWWPSVWAAINRAETEARAADAVPH